MGTLSRYHLLKSSPQAGGAGGPQRGRPRPSRVIEQADDPGPSSTTTVWRTSRPASPIYCPQRAGGQHHHHRRRHVPGARPHALRPSMAGLMASAIAVRHRHVQVPHLPPSATSPDGRAPGPHRRRLPGGTGPAELSPPPPRQDKSAGGPAASATSRSSTSAEPRCWASARSPAWTPTASSWAQGPAPGRRCAKAKPDPRLQTW